ncbi:uncharacterized protein K452DRAFT_321372 [Aplosporella prunicola CBS 121167]|uniref:C2H2-type domain-containing protein n=1 Tax=Aplosporella prunicola CBS 121167 TaxID=1176127 RepID=A0A6A6B4W0_9PEZI|nr:uncharacterized protein K452DRAFT_321372 [Aplosporella prunicola CBS 121167]KAF2137997.1 hypothetical protein K452DRAFT_321372 [Aplosporella prunicola CBS 121167]
MFDHFSEPIYETVMRRDGGEKRTQDGYVCPSQCPGGFEETQHMEHELEVPSQHYGSLEELGPCSTTGDYPSSCYHCIRRLRGYDSVNAATDLLLHGQTPETANMYTSLAGAAATAYGQQPFQASEYPSQLPQDRETMIPGDWFDGLYVYDRVSPQGIAIQSAQSANYLPAESEQLEHTLRAHLEQYSAQQYPQNPPQQANPDFAGQPAQLLAQQPEQYGGTQIQPTSFLTADWQPQPTQPADDTSTQLSGRSGSRSQSRTTRSGSRSIRGRSPGNGSYECTDCSRRFQRRTDLEHHRRSHTANEERPFRCTHESCGWAFLYPKDLERHVQKHRAKPRQVPCMNENCSKMFTLPYNMRRHYSKSHES